jgi:hypothetical protein
MCHAHDITSKVTATRDICIYRFSKGAKTRHAAVESWMRMTKHRFCILLLILGFSYKDFGYLRKFTMRRYVAAELIFGVCKRGEYDKFTS